MLLEALPSFKPTALDPFGLLQPDERNALEQLLEEGIPIPCQIDKKAWKIKRAVQLAHRSVQTYIKKTARPRETQNAPVRFNLTTLRTRCDFHPNARGRWIVIEAPRGAQAPANSVLCNNCHTRRLRFPTFSFRALVSNPSVCCTNVMDNTGRVSCTGCISEGNHIARELDVFETSGRRR